MGWTDRTDRTDDPRMAGRTDLMMVCPHQMAQSVGMGCRVAKPVVCSHRIGGLRRKAAETGFVAGSRRRRMVPMGDPRTALVGRVDHQSVVLAVEPAALSQAPGTTAEARIGASCRRTADTVHWGTTVCPMPGLVA